MTALSTDIYSLECAGPSCVLPKVGSAFLCYYTIRSHLHICGHVAFPFFGNVVSHLEVGFKEHFTVQKLTNFEGMGTHSLLDFWEPLSVFQGFPGQDPR